MLSGVQTVERGGKGAWFARAYDLDKEKYSRKALGDYGSLSGHEVFTHAKRDAENWADKVESGGVQLVKLETVADACRAYLKNRPGAIAEGVFRRHVYEDPIARVKLDKLRRHHLKEWRKRLEEPRRLSVVTRWAGSGPSSGQNLLSIGIWCLCVRPWGKYWSPVRQTLTRLGKKR